MDLLHRLTGEAARLLIGCRTLRNKLFDLIPRLTGEAAGFLRDSLAPPGPS